MRRRSTLVLCAGGLILLVGAGVSLQPWLEALRWQDSPQAAQAQRNAAAPRVVPVRPTATLVGQPPLARPAVTVATPGPGTARAPTAGAETTRPRAGSLAGTPGEVGGGEVPGGEARGGDLATPPPAIAPTPTLEPAQLQLGDVAFQFQDPPQPGANVRLTATIHNPTDAPGGQVSLDLSVAWLSGYTIQGIEPLPADQTLNGQRIDRNLRFTFDGPAAGDDLQVSVFLVTTDEVIDAPNVRVLDAEGREVGQVQPPTEAPQAEPGPVYAIDIPRLHLHTGVVQVEWEPPLFVVGQLRGSAHVTEGNSVLVGHVRGAAGYNVFDHLDQVHVGDQVIASSRGETYEFVVSRTQVLPEEDMSPTQATDTPRLTLMTCAGDWNPLTLDYSERLWVVAEPVGLVTQRGAQPTAVPATLQVAQRGGLGNTDVDLAQAFGAPVGESDGRLAVYRRNGIEHRAQLVDLPAGLARRATLVVEHAQADAALTLDQAVQHSRGLFPKDARPRAAGPEGNARFVVERFSSATLANVLPVEAFAALQGQPGDFLVVYARRPDGRITDMLVGIGDDPASLLDLLNAKH